MPCSRRRRPARRSPFLYAQAIDEKRLTAASLLDDAPINLAAGGGLYIPQNYDKDFKGWVSVRSALGGSLNVPAVRTLVLVTPHRFARTLTALGLPLAQEGDYYGFSLALGSADVTLLSLTNAYRALANGGVARKVIDVPAPASGAAGASDASPARAADGTRVFSDAASFVVTDIPPTTTRACARSASTIRSRRASSRRSRPAPARTCATTGPSVSRRAIRSACGSAMRTARRCGTCRASRARRRCGRPSSATCTATSRAVRRARRPASRRAASRSNAISNRHATSGSSRERRSTRSGSPPRHAGQGRRARALTIGTPTDGTIFAIDPDIPPKNQRIWFERSAGRATKFAWRLDDKVIGHADRIAWMPWPGRHRLELVDARGNVADTIRFEVRGAFAKASARAELTKRASSAPIRDLE